ncbi:bifunctional folylpolyglutamate synthase/dihydrofolate synthase [Allokutzneria sp. A3M-2-11 16]|uniref:bifunctional tetrahydrofolate synthase/dihydrofolate synthase n=1 Tax=Allokutzneria sp. A3M-2-11 16 TaxID=2962043 RepID=UPI0020B74AC4|nr:folylpolyglutamate synthase/dihydrofolate synthase family protein [Allokutzneria sp. A3M-2-11 16]MCP3800934.1 bifunctional folylpolyglutamate synthase/dihydrofolate synthase [Allokutzneria sp. A3M-2-11 16]
MPRTDPAALAAFAAVEAELNQRWPETKLEPSLDRIRALVDLLGEPQRSYPVLHLTGTNGKTSTSRMLDALLTGLGLRTGRYTSPHLQLATERISVDGAPISAERYVEVYRDIEPYLGMVDKASQDAGQPVLSKFEVLTAMAFAAFADAPVDAAVVEVGLGGSWDATNVADGQVSLITPIGVDHVDFLGDDVLKIAEEKAGIIKPGSVAVLAEQDAEVAAVLLKRCVEVDATVARQGMEFGVLEREIAVGGQMLRLQGLSGVYDEIFLPLHGEHQAKNASLALAAAEAFFGAGPDRQLDVEAIRVAFGGVSTPGRLERMRAAPAVLVDAAHNPHGARALAATISSEFAFRRLIAVVGVMRDKDASGILSELEPVVSEVVLTQNSSPRAMDADELAGIARSVFGEDRIVVEPRLEDAIEVGVQLAEETDSPDEVLSGGGVLITGSVITAGDTRALFGKEPS